MSSDTSHDHLPPAPTTPGQPPARPHARAPRPGTARLPAYVWPLLAGWIVVIAAAAVFAPKLSRAVQQEIPVVQGADSLAAADLVNQEFGDRLDQNILIVFQSDTLPVTDPAYQADVEAVLAQVRQVEGVTGVTSYYDHQAATLLGHDGRSTLAVVDVSASKEDVIDRILPALKAKVASLRSGPVRFYITGEAAIALDARESSGEALHRTERLTIPLVLIALLLVFASPIAAGIPLAVGAISVAITSAILYFLTRVTTVDYLAPSMISMMGMGVGVDYSLFVVSRFRQELARGLDKQEAMRRTLATSGKAVLFSGATVVVSVASVFVVRIDMMRTLSMAVTLVIISAVLTALTFLPLVLLLLGKNIDRLALPMRQKRAEAGRGFWHAWAMGIMNRPWVFLVLALIPLFALAWPVHSLTTGFSLLELVPQEMESRQATDILGAQFETGLVSPIEVVVKVPTGTVVSEDNLKRLYDLAQTLKADPEVAEVVGVTSLQNDWTYDDYHALFVDDPQKLVTAAGNLDEAASGITKSADSLGRIKAGLDQMKAELSSFATSAASATEKSQKTIGQLATQLQSAVKGIQQVRDGLATTSGATSEIADALNEVRASVASAKASLDAMGAAAKTDPQYQAAYRSVGTALAILDGVNPQTGQSSGALAANLSKAASGLTESAAALQKVQDGLSQAVSALSALGKGPGTQAQGATDPGQALAQATSALDQATAALDRVIAGLDTIGGGLHEAATKSSSIDLGSLTAQSDLPMKLVVDQAPAEMKDTLQQLVNVDSGSNTTIFKVIARHGPDEVPTRQLVNRIRAVAAQAANTDGFEIHVGGMAAYLVDFNAELTRALPEVMGLVLAITFVVLLILLRSVVLPLKAVLMNTLSVATSYGLLTLVFQEGHGAALIGLAPVGYLESPIILMLFAALFGLSMDYEVFLLSRVRERYDYLGHNEEAVAQGLEETAGIITGAAAIMVMVFGAFVFTGLIAMKEFGFGLAIAVALDATLIRLVLAPSFMRLMGEWNWWAPGWLKRVLPSPNIED